MTITCKKCGICYRAEDWRQYQLHMIEVHKRYDQQAFNWSDHAKPEPTFWSKGVLI